MNGFMKKVMLFIEDDDGASAIEYALLVGLIALAIAVGAGLLGNAINKRFSDLATNTVVTGS